MKKNTPVKIVFMLLVMFILPPASFGQNKLVIVREVIGTRPETTVMVDVETSSDKYVFYGQNNSFIPYQLELNFGQLNNLDPQVDNYKFVIGPGRTRLFELNIRQKNVPPSYQYKFCYYMGDPATTADIEFPYLIPLTKNKKVTTADVSETVGVSNFLFTVSAGDTLFAMRKGRVASTPENKSNLFQFYPLSLEIYHHDGTVASYHVPECISLVREGQLVYPGQPVMIVTQTASVTLGLYRFFSNDSTGSLSISYTVDGKSLLSPAQLNGITSEHPSGIIQKELTKAELKKWEKGSLYK